MSVVVPQPRLILTYVPPDRRGEHCRRQDIEASDWRFEPGQPGVTEHDWPIGVPLTEARRVAILERLHWEHYGPGARIDPRDEP